MLRNISYKFRRNRFRRNRFMKSQPGAIVIIIGIILILSISMLFPHFIRNTYKVTITNKQIVKHNNTDEYLIYTQTEDGDIRVFQNTNNFLELKFNSKDLYLAISINREYEVRAYGFNIPILTHYQNIVKIKGL